MRYLVYLMLLFVTGGALAQAPTILQGNYVSNVFGQSNFIRNPNAQTNTANVTVSNATVSRSTTTPLVATSEFTITTSTATGFADWATRTFDSGMKGQNCEARFSYRGFSVGTTTAQIRQGTNTVAQLVLTPSTDPRIASINFPCGDLSTATTFRLQQATASLTGTNEISGIYLGLATNQANVAQAETVVRAAGTTGTSIASGFTGATVIFNTETFDQLGEYDPATGVFTAKRAGRYSIQARTTFDYVFSLPASSDNWLKIQKNSIDHNFCITSHPNANWFLSLQCETSIDLVVGDNIRIVAVQSTGAARTLRTDQQTSQLIVSRFPTSSELVVTPERQNVWGGVQYRNATNTLLFNAVAAPTAYSAFNAAGWNQPTMLKGKAAVTTTGSGNDLGFSIPNMPVGSYKLNVSGFLMANTGGSGTGSTRVRCSFRVRETTTSSVIAQSTAQNWVINTASGISDSRDYPHAFHGVYNNTAVATRNFILEASKINDNVGGNIGQCEVVTTGFDMDLTITIEPLDQPSNSALYVQGPVLGAQTGAAIPAGYVGEELFAADATPQSTTSATYNTLSLALTPGVWDVSGSCRFDKGGATFSDPNFIAGITNQNANPFETVLAQLAGSAYINSNTVGLATPTVRVRWDGVTNITYGSNNTSSNLVYIRCFPGTFTGGPVSVLRRVRAVRVN